MKEIKHQSINNKEQQFIFLFYDLTYQSAGAILTFFKHSSFFLFNGSNEQLSVFLFFMLVPVADIVIRIRTAIAASVRPQLEVHVHLMFFQVQSVDKTLATVRALMTFQLVRSVNRLNVIFNIPNFDATLRTWKPFFMDFEVFQKAIPNYKPFSTYVTEFSFRLQGHELMYFLCVTFYIRNLFTTNVAHFFPRFMFANLSMLCPETLRNRFVTISTIFETFSFKYSFATTFS